MVDIILGIVVVLMVVFVFGTAVLASEEKNERYTR